MCEIKGHLLFCLLFGFILGLITFLSFLFAELLSVARAGRLEIDFLILAGSGIGLFLKEKTEDALKDKRVSDFLSSAGFLLWFRLFEVAFSLTVIFSLLLTIPIWYSEETFTQHRFLYSFLACFLLLCAGVFRGSLKLTERVKEKLEKIQQGG